MKIGFGKLLVVCAVMNVVLAATEVRAGYSTGFEEPTFSLGNVNGQDGWLAQLSPPLRGPVIIQNTTVASGKQALEIQATGPLSRLTTFAQQNLNLGSGGKTVRAEFDFLYHGSLQTGFSAFGDTGYVGQLSTVGGKFFLGNSSSSVFSGASANGVWYRLTMDMNFAAQTIEGFVDGTSIGSLAMNPPSPANNFIGFQFVSYNSGGATQKAYFDNFSIKVIPEPSSFTLAGLGGIFLVISAFRRRQRVM